jgi:uncharacterized protein (TIGR02118 family)
MFKFVTIYRRVDDEAALDTFFSNTHLPLAEKLPGLRHREVSHIHGKPGGESRFYLMVELYFDSREDYLRALASEPGIELMQALVPWDEARLVTWFYADSFAEEMAPAVEEADSAA